MNPQDQNTPTQESSSSFGPIIGIVVIVIVLIIGALYFWNERVGTTDNKEMMAEEISTTETQTESGETSSAADTSTVSSEDDMASIEADLSGSFTEEYDFSDIEAELQ